MNWRILESGPLRGAENMAHDQALLEGVQAGGPPVLRFYRWAPACLSLGRNQVVARPREVAAAVAARGFDLVRRATGGAAVLHDRELTYSVAVPVRALGSPRETYVAINRALVAGRRGIGGAAEEAAGGGLGARRPGPADSASSSPDGTGSLATPSCSPMPRPGATPSIAWESPCFQAPAPGEVVVGGLKLVGSAQRREGRTLLQHGSLLLAGDQGVVAACLAGRGSDGRSDTGISAELDASRATGSPPVPSAPPGFTTLAALLDPLPSWSELMAALSAGFAETLGVEIEPSEMTPAERARIEPLTAHFESPDWTWRR
jgi:lipoate-protein ligase A